LLCAAAFAVGLAPGLSSCSKETGKGSTEQAGGAQEAASPGAQDTSSQSAQNAKALVKRMSDYLAAQQSIALSYDSIFEVVSRDHQKLQLATSGTVDLVRPDKLRTTRKSGFSDSEMVFDGKTLSILGKGQNAFVQAQAPGTVDQLIDQLRDKFHRQLPGADLLQSGVYDGLM